MSDFEAYRKRAERVKALEELFEPAKRVFVSAQYAGTSEPWLSLAALKAAIEKVESIPAPKKP